MRAGFSKILPGKAPSGQESSQHQGSAHASSARASLARHRGVRTLSIMARLSAMAAGLLAAMPALSRPLALDDMYQLQNVSDPQISPDGAWVAYEVGSTRRERDADDQDIWITSWNGRQTLRMTNSPYGEHSPRWSPDGRYLAFLTDRGDTRAGDQIWLLDKNGGEPHQLSHTSNGISGYAWSPDGQRIVFSSENESPESDSAEKVQPIVIDRLQFRSDNDSGFLLQSERTHLFLLNVQSGEVTQLTDGPYDELQPAWSPDGSQIVFLSKRGPDPDATNNWDLYLTEPHPNSTPRQLTTNPGTDGDPTEEWGSESPSFSPDGKSVTYTASGKPEDFWYSLVQVGVTGEQQGSATLPAAALDRNTIDPQWSADGKWVYFRLEDDLSVLLARVRVKDGRVERLTAPGGVVSEFDVGPRGRVAVVYGTADRPGEINAVEGHSLRPITHHNDSWLSGVELAKARAIQFKSRDGLPIRGLLMVPPGNAPAGRRPTLLRLHGGPVAQSQYDFDFEWQLMAANGYVIVGPNPRGSSGRGYDFQKMLFADWGHADVPDVLAAADYAVSIGIADPQRLGVGGWSYGAILTNYVISSDTRFKAATSGAGMGNMLAGYGVDQYVREWEFELGLPWENTDRWLRVSSPFLHANRITTPTLFMVGSEDSNVPPIGSEQMYEALRRLEVPTQLVVYPGQHHGFERPSFRADRVKRYIEWYGRFLKPDGL